MIGAVTVSYTHLDVYKRQTHIMERYFTNTTHVDLTDRLCEGALRSIIANGVKTLEEPEMCIRDR